MNRLALCGGRVLLPDGLHDDLCVVVEGASIAAVTRQAPDDADRIDLGGRLLLPGFIDTQVNGGGGRLLNDDPCVDTIAAIAAAHRRYGTTGLLPTLITDELSVVARAIRAVDEAIAAGVPGILGIHIEGPFLSPARKGIHRAELFRRLDEEGVALLCSAAAGRTMVTVAPDMAEPAQIARLAAAGVIVSAGHSDAGYDTARAAIEAGVTGFTHLFNAMSPLGTRAPGMVGAALDDERVFAGIIADGHHLHPVALRLAVRAKGPERLMLVSDAMPSVGSDADSFVLQGRTIRREGDVLRGPDGTLAGSTLTMAGAVRGVMRQAGVALVDAVRMASATPAAFLGLSHCTGAIVPGLAADLVLADDALGVHETWIGGVSSAAAGVRTSRSNGDAIDRSGNGA